MHRYKIEERKVYPIFAAKKFHKEISHDGAQNLWQGLEMNQVIPGSWDSQSVSTVRRIAGSEGVLFFFFFFFLNMISQSKHTIAMFIQCSKPAVLSFNT